MNELIGRRCGCEFDLPATEWPVQGYPALVIIEAVDMPMVKIASCGQSFWINASKIKKIWAIK